MSALAAPLPLFAGSASAQAPASAPAQPPAPAPPAPPPPAAAPPAAAAPSAAAPPVAAAPPTPAAPPAGALPPGTVAPGDLHHGAIELLTNRHLHFARRYHRLLGDPLSLPERHELRAHLAQLAPQTIRVETREVREDIRRLRRKLERHDGGGAPDIAIPSQLSAIAQCESGGDPRAISSNGTYRGKYQFDFSTWASVGGKGDPAAASETEQDRRAAMLYRAAGPGRWPVCGR